MSITLMQATMPTRLDILMERLKQFDEVTLLELLDVTSEDILERFKDKVISRKDTLFGEIELLIEGEDDESEDEAWDGYQIEEPFTEGEDD